MKDDRIKTTSETGDGRTTAREGAAGQPKGQQQTTGRDTTTTTASHRTGDRQREQNDRDRIQVRSRRGSRAKRDESKRGRH